MRLDKGEGEKDGGGGVRIVITVVPYLKTKFVIINWFIVLSCLIKRA